MKLKKYLRVFVLQKLRYGYGKTLTTVENDCRIRNKE